MEMSSHGKSASACSGGRRGSRAAASALLAAAVAAAPALVPATAVAAQPPSAEQQTVEQPGIEVFAADGTTPLGGTAVRSGDTIVVKGHGFDPRANTEGLPLPVLPGTPHGVFVAFGAFAPQWRPSQGAPSDARDGQNRSATAWVMTDEALGAVPDVPFDLRRTIRQQWAPMDDDGSFTARLTVAPPAAAPDGARYGVYSYAAAGAVNAEEELFVPVRFDPAPGPNTPVPPEPDLVWGFSPGFDGLVTDTLMGAADGDDGAAVRDDGRWTFRSAGADVDPATGFGTARYEGTVVLSTKFHLLEIAVSDPWIEFTPDGTWLSAETSTGAMVGTDSMSRVRLARLDLPADADRRSAEDVTGTFTVPTGQPDVLLPYSGQPIAPLDFTY
ncbi:HtaA domain-containing protein [Tomitella cavernea]|uniref:Htaa domain-containing protein n=1 Tax=Tomitella cavernea TaxID=1387982 RepID=A0ABP9CWJ5_9ACTN|nr:HtaA domain-containing protein [Tomitella cavernea]